MQLQARLLLCAVVVWVAIAGADGRPQSATLPREARERTGFHTAHQDAGISKYSDHEDSLRSESSHTAGLDDGFLWRQDHNISNESPATAENILPSTENPLFHELLISTQQEDFNDDHSPTENVMMPTETPQNATEEPTESNYVDSTITPSSTEHTTSFIEQIHAVNTDSDSHETLFPSQADQNNYSHLTENISTQDGSEAEQENFNGYAFEKESSGIPQQEEQQSPDLESKTSSSVNKNSFTIIPEQSTEQIADAVVSNSLPASPQESGQETVISSQPYYENYQLQNTNSNENYHQAQQQTAQAQNLIDHINYKGYNGYNKDKREMLPPSNPVDYYNYDSSHSTPVYSSVPNTQPNTNNYFQSVPASQYAKNSYVYQDANRQGFDVHDKTEYARNLRNFRSLYYPTNGYTQTSANYISPNQVPYTDRSQVLSSNANPNSPTPLIQAPYSVTYRIFNTNVFESAGAGGSQIPRDAITRQLQLSWPFADYFPIVINDPFLAAFNAFSNMFEYGPDADICRRLSAQKDGLVRVAQVPQDATRYEMNQAGAYALHSVHVPGATTVRREVAAASGSPDVHGASSAPGQSEDEVKTLDDEKPTEIIMSSNDSSRNVTFVTKLVLRKGGVSIAGPGGIATAGSGGLAIVGPGGVAYTSPNGMAIVGPGGKVIGLPRGGEFVFDQHSNPDGEGAKRYLGSIPPGGRVVAEGPTVYYHPPQ